MNQRDDHGPVCAMAAHPTFASVQRVTMGTLFNSSFQRVNVRPMRAGGAVEAVRAAKANHPTVESIQQEGAHLLAILAPIIE